MHLFASIMTLIVTLLILLILLATWRLGDWRNWRRYYPTIMFMVSLNLLSSLLQYDYPLWTFEKTVFIPNHTLADLFVVCFNLVPLVLLYLSRYPFHSGWKKELLYMLLYVVIFCLVEWFFVLVDLTTYDHGWNLLWSFYFWAQMFLLFRLHDSRPLLAWGVSLAFAAYIVFYFDIPITTFR